MDGACGMHREEQKGIQAFGWQRDHLEDLNLDWKISLTWIVKGAWAGLA